MRGERGVWVDRTKRERMSKRYREMKPEDCECDPFLLSLSFSFISVVDFWFAFSTD